MSQPKPFSDLLKLFRSQAADASEDGYWKAAHSQCADDLESLLKEWQAYFWAEDSTDLQAGEVTEKVLGMPSDPGAS